jgi:UDPglucose--hexose-1-phosphate uridylyltransferase
MARMELRKDPITRSWVMTTDGGEGVSSDVVPCRFCPGSQRATQIIGSMPSLDGGTWSACAMVHPAPLYRIEGDPQRAANGIYDRMRGVGAHEVLVEAPSHDGHIWNTSDAQITQFLKLLSQRILDLKQDPRFKYISVFKNHGQAAGQEFDHPTSQLTATTFVPRRVLYELRACREYYAAKERCVFCDIVAQEETQKVRVVEARGDYIAACPYAPRVPYETWVLPRPHEASFELAALKRDNLADLAALVRRTLARIRTISEHFHLVLHTLPNTLRKSTIMNYWKTIDEDYHWHIEILPIITGRAKSYTFKEVYFTDVTSETAAARLRDARIEE